MRARITWRVYRVGGGTVHCVAMCTRCDWQADDYHTAAGQARAHVRTTGHEVMVERALTYTVAGVPGASEDKKSRE